ncbi:MAG: FAD-binding protein [Sandaracinaceae bacterium]
MSGGSQRLRNWSSSLSWRPADVWEPDSVGQLGEMLTDALTAGRRVRPLGRKYSFSGAIVDDDVALDLHRLSDLSIATRGDASSALGRALTEDAWRDPSTAGYALVGAGVSLDALCAAGASRGVAPFVLGGSSGQTVIGAFSTSTHGAAFDLPPLPDFVEGLYLLTGERQHWIERGRAGPLLDPAQLPALLGAPGGLITHRDRELFDAAVVSLGGIGVIAVALIRLRDANALMNERLWPRRAWTKLRPALLSGDAFERPPVDGADGLPGKYRYLELIFDPYDRDETTAWVCTRHLVDAPGGDPSPALRGSPNLLKFARTIGTNFARYSKALSVLVETSRLRGVDDAGEPLLYELTEVMNTGVPTPQPVWSFELVWPAASEDYLQFLDQALALVRKKWAAGRPFMGLFTLRFSKSTTAHLAMQHDANPSARYAHVEISPLQDVFNNSSRLSDNNVEFLDAMFAIPTTREARLHWGQGDWSSLRFDARRYPRLESWRKSARQLADADGALFRSPFLEEAHVRF